MQTFKTKLLSFVSGGSHAILLLKVTSRAAGRWLSKVCLHFCSALQIRLIQWEPIFAFADVPHLIKLFRNWLLKPEGITLKSGCKVTKKPLVELWKKTRSEINSMFKLSYSHLNLNTIEKQNVKLSVQLLYATVARGLKDYVGYEENPDEDLRREAVELSEVINIVNDWFDTLNSRTMNESILFKKPYGLALEAQSEALKNMNDLVRNMNCNRIADLEIFQQGILQTNNSLEGLFKNMKTKHNVSYILTKNLNQDCLEAFFGHLRARNGCDVKPSALQCLHSIKVISLGKNISNLKRNPNSEEEAGVNYLIAESFKRADVALEVELESDLDSSSQSSVDTLIPEPVRTKSAQSEKDGLEYLSGFLARKFY